MRLNTIAALAALGALLCGAAAPTSCVDQTVGKSDAQTLSASFCSTYLPAVKQVVGEFNAQIRADYATASRACAMIADGKSVNVFTVGLAALALYEGVSATYPKLGALSDHDIATARRLTISLGVMK